MSIDDLLERGRAAAMELMQDTCEVVRVTGSDTDLDTGVVTETTEQVYAGKCRVQQAAATGDATAGDKVVGEAALLMVGRTLQLPVVASAGVRAGDRVTIIACQHDPDLVGRQFTVRAEFAKTHATARRLGIEEVTS